jgi:hypothetical protein
MLFSNPNSLVNGVSTSGFYTTLPHLADSTKATIATWYRYLLNLFFFSNPNSLVNGVHALPHLADSKAATMATYTTY